MAASPARTVVDNLKAAVLDADWFDPNLNPKMADFAKHYGFEPRLCRPYRARTKGKVERMNGYLRRSFYVPLAAKLKAEVAAEIWTRR